MPQSTPLFEDNRISAPVIALDRYIVEKPENNEKYIKILNLVQTLSRYLSIEKIINIFSQEIQSQVPHQGYRYCARDPELDFSGGDIEGACANYRLKLQDHYLGEVSFYRQTDFGSKELRDLEDMLCAAIYPVRNALMYRVALNSAHIDPTTGLNNRVAMEELLPREIELAHRHDQPMAILVMDLDGFKQVNDTHGHDVGDGVLRDVSSVLTHAVRNTDLLYRYGGDEFVCGLPQTDLNGAFEVGERIIKGIAAIPNHDDQETGRVGISIGVTMITKGDDFSSAFRRADHALYSAKQSGKNRITIN